MLPHERQYRDGVVVRDLIDSLVMFWKLGSPSLHGVGSPPCTQCMQGGPRLMRRPAGCCVELATALAGPFSGPLGPAADQPLGVMALP